MKKKSIIITISTIIAAALIISIIFIVKNNSSSSKVTTIGFYNIPEENCKIYEEIITKENNGKIKFQKLEEKDLDTKKLGKKINMLITYNGALTQKLLPEAENLPNDIISRFPRTIRESELYNYDEKPKIFPISLDIFESMILTTAVNYYNLPLPKTTTDITDFGKQANKIYPFPIIISGADDLTINSFFTQLVEAFGGKTGYENIRKQITEDPSLKNFYNYTITESPTKKITVTTILELLKSWEKEGILSRKWHETSKQRTAQLIEDNRTSMAIMNLSEHRNVTSDNIYYYEKIIFPSMPDSNDGIRLSIQPAIVGMILKNSPDTKDIASRLTTPENQELISMQTKLGPATSQGTSFDRQADDARFFAASFPGGPVPDLATLVFTDKESQHKMAELIRNYK